MIKSCVSRLLTWDCIFIECVYIDIFIIYIVITHIYTYRYRLRIKAQVLDHSKYIMDRVILASYIISRERVPVGTYSAQ